MGFDGSELRPLDLNSQYSTLLPEVEQAENSPPPEWTMHVHPQGWVYFYSRYLKVVTDQDIRDPEIYQIVNRNTANYPLTDLDVQMEIQLLVQTTGVGDNLFLVVNHKECVASYDLHEVRDENVAFLNPAMLNRRRRLYWNYLWNHPSHVPTPTRAIPDASDALTWFFTDNLISGAKSIAPFSKTECEDLTRALHQMSKPYNDGSIAKTVFLAWLLREVCSFRDSEQFGKHTQKDSVAIRRERALPLHNNSRRPSAMVLPFVNLVITLLFFGIPYTYYWHIKASSEYRGRLANVQANWENYVERLVREYCHFLLISTVLLSATVALLGINDINDTAQVCATISALASLGSIIVGVFSIWRHQTNACTSDSFKYMYNAQHGNLGFHGHAMLLSLPPVLLIWAILTFTVSIMAYTLRDITGVNTISSISAWTIIGIFIILLVTVIAALYTFAIIWKFQDKSSIIGHWKLACTWRRTHNNVAKA